MKAYVLMIGLVLLLSGCTKTQGSAVDCSKINDREKADECALNQSIRSLDVGKCDDILNTELQAQCIDEIAVRVGEFYACNAHDKKSLKDACETKVGEARRARKT
ncbi:MAG: hypothetical protein KKD39_01620 [Candidatus Altiarchaeota archaeon]|nr:hypothetical protein [Candidatus Altiarchaeota archaeon]